MTIQRVAVIILGIIVLGALSLFLLSLGNTPSEYEADLPDVPDNQSVAVVNLAEGLPEELTPKERGDIQYIKIVDSCNYAYGGACVNVRSGPGTDNPVITKLRNGMVLRIGEEITNDKGEIWYKITFDNQWLRYPERLFDGWYIRSDQGELVYNEGDRTRWEHETEQTDKRIIVDRSDQMLYAYDGDELFMATPTSTGLQLSPTPLGTHEIFKKTPSRYMQGPIPGIPGSDYYDLPGVPWNLYFTEQGAVIHGAYWHESFGTPYSHGCVNLDTSTAEELYNWATLGTAVIVQE